MPNASRDHRRDQRPEHEPGDVERGEPTEVGAHRVGFARDHDAAHRRADRAAAEPEQQARHEERPELRGQRAADHRSHREQDPAAHEHRCVAAVGEAGERELGDEPGEEPGGDDVAELRLGEAVAVAQVGEQRVDRAVPERHAPGDDAVGEQPPAPDPHRAVRPGQRSSCARASSRTFVRTSPRALASGRR